jgi:hypothetical protein
MVGVSLLCGFVKIPTFETQPLLFTPPRAPIPITGYRYQATNLSSSGELELGVHKVARRGTTPCRAPNVRPLSRK